MARKDSELKERAFSTPLGLQCMRAASSSSRVQCSIGGKGGGSKNGGKKRQAPPPPPSIPKLSRTGGKFSQFKGLVGNGKQICYAFNNQSE
eukprot:190865-Amphidinium_carterae.1